MSGRLPLGDEQPPQQPLDANADTQIDQQQQHAEGNADQGNGEQPNEDHSQPGDPADTAPQGANPEGQPQRRADRRFSHLTARLEEQRQARERAEREAAELRELLAARQPPEGGEQTRQPPARDDAEIEQRAQALLAQREFDTKKSTLISTGVQQMGATEWQEATDILSGYGLTSNQTFLSTIVDVDNGAAVIAELSQDHAKMDALARMQPTKMALEIARMAYNSKPPPAAPGARAQTPQGNGLSRAPQPASRLPARGTAPAPDLYDPKMNAKEWIAERNRQAAAAATARRR